MNFNLADLCPFLRQILRWCFMGRIRPDNMWNNTEDRALCSMWSAVDFWCHNLSTGQEAKHVTCGQKTQGYIGAKDSGGEGIEEECDWIFLLKMRRLAILISGCKIKISQNKLDTAGPMFSRILPLSAGKSIDQTWRVIGDGILDSSLSQSTSHH